MKKNELLNKLEELGLYADMAGGLIGLVRFYDREKDAERHNIAADMLEKAMFLNVENDYERLNKYMRENIEELILDKDLEPAITTYTEKIKDFIPFAEAVDDDKVFQKQAFDDE